ncbi:hypothetical protein OSB04_022209 [Centaurea solstitialis]|uniref:Sesquiterpene synthase n=1 Tax=Centaurea solstitialis TaxID=347529 RepID=A0AA38WIH4_9ASTR|nr:hypothetical protein OSB04_022209 [Centaurea solstitialis]
MSLPFSTVPMSSSPSSIDHNKSIKQEVIRNTMISPRSIWGDQFLTYNERKDRVWEEQQVKELSNEMSKQLRITGSAKLITQHVKVLELIDAVQRLGVAYHFKDEIEECLNQIYVMYGDQWVDNNDLKTTSLWFRLLRQQGFNVSSGVFNKYKNADGNFLESLRDDVSGMLSLYEATYMRVEGEEVLDKALEFTTYHLGNIVENHVCSHDPSLEMQIQEALQQPLRKRLPRLEAVRYIPIYQQQASHDKALLKLAKLDYNLLQDLHRKELSQICKWWKDLDASNKLPYVRDRIVEGYFWMLAIYFEPQHSDARIFLMKACHLLIIIDDTYDNYGTYEELEIFTEAVQRWSTSCLDMLPEYMKLIYQILLDVHKEAEELLEKKGENKFSFAKQEKEYTRNVLIEAKWLKDGYVPTFDEHMAVTLITGAYVSMIAKAYVHEDLVDEETFKWLSTYPPIVKASCLIVRLMNDIATHKKDQERVHIPSSIECYMKEYGVSDEEACEILSKQVEDGWKVINKESLRPTCVPMPLLMPPINLARICDAIYKRGDAYTFVGEEMIQYINSLLVNPMI